MNHWPFIIAAYALTLFGTGWLSIASWRATRRAEARVDALNKEA